MAETEKETLQLEHRQRQEQVLAPQLRASLRVLQMDRQALAAEIRHEAETNPVVELEESDGTTPVSEAMAAEAGVEADAERHEDDESNPVVNVNEDSVDRRQRFFDRQVAVESLQEHLVAQLPLSGLSEADRQVAEFIIGDIDDSGRYVGQFDELICVLGVDNERLERILRVVQTFDPPGVGARSARECLIIQAELGDMDESVRGVVRDIIYEYLDEVAKGDIPALAETLKVDPKLCEEAVSVLKSFEPRPGRPYQSPGTATQYIYPELKVVPGPDGYELESREDGIPKIRINPVYEEMLDDSATAPETRVYLRERMDSASRLQEAIRRRGETIMRVAEAVFAIQDGFLRHGFASLRPLTIESVAKVTGYHGTTVGRAVRGKYVETPRGIYELKKFFCVGHVEDDEGRVFSATAVKRRLAQILAAGRGKHLSDEEITRRFGDDGVRISRRTIAKYRAEMGIPAQGRRGRKVGGEKS